MNSSASLKRASRQSGFTLLEIMLVVMIIAILVGGAIVMVGPALGSAKEAKVKTDIQTIKTELLMYQATTGSLPTTEQGLRALVERPGDAPNWRQFASEVPQDPWHRNYYYESPSRRNNPDGYDVYSAGEDGKAGTADDIGNWKSDKP